MWDMGKKLEPSLKLVFLTNKEENQKKRVLCSEYPRKGCVTGSGKRIKLRLVELLALQYKTKREACEAAVAIGQWYAFNWLFDDVTNEPVLENFVQKAFKAQRPKHKTECY